MGMNVTLNQTKWTIRMAHTHPLHGRYPGRPWSGDIIGLYDTGNLQIGDTLHTGSACIKPRHSLPSELFMKVTKNVTAEVFKGIEQLGQLAGPIQLYKTYHTEEHIIGAVGQLHLKSSSTAPHEYNARWT